MAQCCFIYSQHGRPLLFWKQQVIGIVNGAFVVAIMVSFTVLADQGAPSGGLEFKSLLHANFPAVPQSIPVIALAFVYQVIVVLTEFFSGC
jgi:hypothetical protein